MKHLVPIHVANYVGSPGTVQFGFKKFYLKNGYYKLYDGVNEDDLVLDRPLDNYTPLPGTITAADSVLTALEKLDYAISNFVVSTGSLQDVVDVGNVINNFGGSGVADIRSVNFTNDRTLYLNNNSFATIKIEDNLNAAHYVIIDIDTINLNGTSYNWSTIVSGAYQDLQQVTDEGSITTNTITVGDAVEGKRTELRDLGVVLYDEDLYPGEDAGFFTIGQLQLRDTKGESFTSIFLGVDSENPYSISMQFLRNNKRVSLILPPTLNANNTGLLLPSKATDGFYTLATLDDIPSYTIPTLQQVTDQGNITTNELISADGLYRTKVTPAEVVVENGSNVDACALQFDGLVRLYDTGSGLFSQTLQFENPSTDGVITIPNGTGTMALLSDIGNYLPLAGGTMDADADIFFANGSKLSEGAVDAQTGGNKGIALTCSLGYEFKWEDGELYITNPPSNFISLKFYARTVPTVDDDSTKGFGFYSRWVTLEGITYRCNDATPGAAVWEFITGAVPTLQEVTDQGNETTHYIKIKDSEKSFTLLTNGINFEDIDEGGTTNLRFINTSILNQEIDIRGLGGTMALLSDIPTNTSDLTNDGADGVNPFITAADIPPSTNGLPTGGTTGQILTKVDATDYNATWQDNYADWTSVVKHTVKNNGLSGTITKGTAVYVTGADGTNMLVGRASNVSESTSSKTMGLMQSDITTTGGTQTGFVVTEGLLGGLNTAGQTAGDPVWLGVNGALIYGLVNKPYAPAHLVFIGIVTKVSAGSGEIFVKVQNGFELKEIHDVDLKSNLPTNNQVLTYESATDLWKNKNLIDILETFNRTQGIYYFEEFMGNQSGTLSASYTNVISLVGGASATVRSATIATRTNQQGVIQHLTGIASTSFSGYQYGVGLYVGSGSISLETYVTVGTLSNVTERFLTIFGYYSGANYNTTADGIFFSYDEEGRMFFEFGAAATPNWKCYTRGAGVTTRTNTSIAVVAGTWYKLRIEINNAANSVTFFINGNLVATHTTNIPATTIGSMFTTSLIVKTAGTTTRSLLTDYFMYKEIFTNPR